MTNSCTKASLIVSHLMIVFTLLQLFMGFSENIFRPNQKLSNNKGYEMHNIFSEHCIRLFDAL